MEFNRKHFRAIIFYDFHCGLSRQESFDSLYSYKTSSYSIVKSWFHEFKSGQCSIQEEFHAGHPKSIVVPENVDAVQE